MRRTMTAFGLLVLIPLALISCFARQEGGHSDAAASVGIVGINASTGKARIRVTNRLERPIIIQGQPETGVGYVLQKKQMGGDNSTGQQHYFTPASQNLGPGTMRLEKGGTLDFDYDAGPPPTAFRVGILYSITPDPEQWILAWSSWWERAG